jgi:dihydrofolate reductase
VPIFILTRQNPDSAPEQWPLVTYVNDVRTAMSEAKRAAGDKDVLVHGAGTAQLALPRPVGHRPTAGWCKGIRREHEQRRDNAPA